MSLNIKQQFVTFQQAKKLKELEFSEPVFCYYDKKGELFYPFVSSTNSSDPEEFIVHLHDLSEDNNAYTDTYSAPEIWQVVEWVSVHYDREIEARPVIYAGDMKPSYYQAYLDGVVANLKKFETRQAALLESIDEFLKSQF